MIRRRILLCCCLFLLLLCMSGWISSHFYWIRVGYGGKIGFSLSTIPGQVSLNLHHSSMWRAGWQIDAQPVLSIIIYGRVARWQFCGFSGGTLKITDPSDPTLFINDYTLSVPYWFLTTLSILLLCFVWWKIHRSNTGRAFPLESDPSQSGIGVPPRSRT